MKASLFILLAAMSLPSTAQTASVIYQKACGPKNAAFDVRQVKEQPLGAPGPGKAIVYFVQDTFGWRYITRVGLDGNWVGAIKNSSYLSAAVAPGEHRACVNWQNVKNSRPQFVEFTAEAGKTYYYLVRSFNTRSGVGAGTDVLEFGQADHDEALFLIASDPQSVATPKP